MRKTLQSKYLELLKRRGIIARPPGELRGIVREPISPLIDAERERLRQLVEQHLWAPYITPPKWKKEFYPPNEFDICRPVPKDWKPHKRAILPGHIFVRVIRDDNRKRNVHTISFYKYFYVDGDPDRIQLAASPLLELHTKAPFSDDKAIFDDINRQLLRILKIKTP